MAHRLLTLNHEKQHYSLLLPYFWQATTANSREKSFVLCLTTRHTSYVIRIKTIVPLTALIVSPEIWNNLKLKTWNLPRCCKVYFLKGTCCSQLYQRYSVTQGDSGKDNNSENTRAHDLRNHLSLHCKNRRLGRALAETLSYTYIQLIPYIYLHAIRQLPLELILPRAFMHLPEQMMMCIIEFLVRISHCTADLYWENLFKMTGNLSLI